MLRYMSSFELEMAWELLMKYTDWTAISQDIYNRVPPEYICFTFKYILENEIAKLSYTERQEEDAVYNKDYEYFIGRFNDDGELESDAESFKEDQIEHIDE